MTDRAPPTFNRVQLPAFGTPEFPGETTMAFMAEKTEDTPPGRDISVECGRIGTWVLTFAPGAPLPAGTRVAFRKVENGFRFDYIHQDYWPDAMGYVSVETAEGEPLPFACDTALKSAIPADVTLPAPWPAGREVVVRIGDRRRNGPGIGAPSDAYDGAHIETGILLPGEEAWRRVTGGTVCVRVVPAQPPHRLLAFAPSTADVNAPMRMSVLRVDINGNPMTLPASLSVGAGGAVACVAQRAGEQGSILELRPSEAGVTRITVSDGEREVVANPVRVGAGEGAGIYWGEFHCHAYDAVELNGLNPNTDPANAYRRGRDMTRLDFMSLGSHIFRYAPEAVSAWWERARCAAADTDAPGAYVPFLGCEWRDDMKAGGDRNLVWRELDAPEPDPTWRVDEVFRRMGEQNGMLTPHVGGAIAYPVAHDGRVEWLCEMTSGHGNFEWFAQSYLQKGYRVGFIGGSDGHKGSPGYPRMATEGGGRYGNVLRRRDCGWSGGPLLAVHADALTREALWTAFRARRTYASTGARALVDFRVNDRMMGAEFTTGDEIDLRFELHGTAPVKRVDLIRNDRRLRRWEPGTMDVSERTTDMPPAGANYYYLRIMQADGEMLWTSPVWVDGTREGPEEALPAWNEEPSVDLEKVGENAATAHLEGLLGYLRREERVEAFEQLTPLEVVHAPMGDYAVFLCRLNGRRTRIHWFYGFEMPRIRLEPGWVPYGPERVMYQSWAAPLFDRQMPL